MITFQRAWATTPFLDGEDASVSLSTAETLGKVLDDVTEEAVADINTENLGNKYLSEARVVEPGLANPEYAGPNLLRAIAKTVSLGIDIADNTGIAPISSVLREYWKSQFSDTLDEDPEHLDDAVTEWLDNLDWVT